MIPESAKLTDDEIKVEQRKGYARGMLGFREEEITRMVEQQGRLDERRVADAAAEKAYQRGMADAVGIMRERCKYILALTALKEKADEY